MENDYDGFAEAYAAENETSLVNAYYAKPAILDLAGNVTGRRILDAGCGSGTVSSALRDRGAVVTGFDRSAKMVELARQRLGADVDLRVADITDYRRELARFPSGSFVSFLFFVLEAV